MVAEEARRSAVLRSWFLLPNLFDDRPPEIQLCPKKSAPGHEVGRDRMDLPHLRTDGGRGEKESHADQIGQRNPLGARGLRGRAGGVFLYTSRSSGRQRFHPRGKHVGVLIQNVLMIPSLYPPHAS